MYSLEHAYLLSILGLMPIWAFLFWFSHDSRRKMIRLSILGSFAGPISQYWYLKDYWEPLYTLGAFGFLEDLLFAGLIFGISGGIISFLLRMKSVPQEGLENKIIRYGIAILVLVGSLFLGASVLNMNSIYVSSFGFLVLALIIWRDRPDLFKYSLMGATFWLLLAFVVYSGILLLWPNFIKEQWFLENISKITFSGIPLEEFLWFGSFGLVSVVIYEWKHGWKFVPRNNA